MEFGWDLDDSSFIWLPMWMNLVISFYSSRFVVARARIISFALMQVLFSCRGFLEVIYFLIIYFFEFLFVFTYLFVCLLIILFVICLLIFCSCIYLIEY